MRLVAIKLVDFQGHEEITIDFSKTITSLKGPTDAGKSSILRALRWVCLNDLGGDEFIREGAKKTKVILTVCQTAKETGDNHLSHDITRIKGTSGLNTYELNGEELKAFGQGVPQDIVKLLNVNEINFQSQHDSPFWFNETAGEVSRRLNAVVDLSVIDTTLSNISSAVRQAQERKTLCHERLEEVKKEYEQLKPQQDRIEEFKKLKAANERFLNAEETCNQLVTLGRNANQLRQQASLLGEKGADGEDVLTRLRLALDTQQATTALESVLIDLSEREKASRPPPDFSSVEKSFNIWHDLDLQIEGLEQIIEQASERFTRIETAGTALEHAEKMFEKNTKGKLCPLCHNPIR